MTSVQLEATVQLKAPHPAQAPLATAKVKRIIVRAGRRGGKTEALVYRGVKAFLAGRRVLYAAPTQDQLETFWKGVKYALGQPLERGAYYKNETSHIIELAGTEQRIRAKTAWNADTLRGDYADELYLDEWQLMNEDAWEYVGAPMLLDNNGNAVFIYTPPSLHSRSVTKAKDIRHAAKMFEKAKADTTGRWAAYHFSSFENPHLSAEALAEISQDMTALAIRQELHAEDSDEVEGALWKRKDIGPHRVQAAPELVRVVIAVDPPGSKSTECGIIGGGIDAKGHGYVLTDPSLTGSPDDWGSEVVEAYLAARADRIVGERNYGGDMVEKTVRTAAQAAGEVVSYKDVQATRGKAVRAEPVAALYEQGRVHHVGEFPELEEELCTWIAGVTTRSPNRLDALVWLFTELMLNKRGGLGVW